MNVKHFYSLFTRAVRPIPLRLTGNSPGQSGRKKLQAKDAGALQRHYLHHSRA
jgi:hypothetical protein